jgi:hypothetical protein
LGSRRQSPAFVLNLLSRADGSVRLAGPTNAFLTDPGHGALLALLHVTTVLLVHGRKATARHFEQLVIISALKTLVDDAGGAFLEAEAFRSSMPLTPARPIRSCLTFLHTDSSGFNSAEYPGRKNSRSRPLVAWANRLTALERCTG